MSTDNPQAYDERQLKKGPILKQIEALSNLIKQEFQIGRRTKPGPERDRIFKERIPGLQEKIRDYQSQIETKVANAKG